jgi:RNA ligase
MKELNLLDFLVRANLTQQRKDGLILFDYNKTVTYNFDWDYLTINSRGIVFEESTGDIVARPYRKFWNHGELDGDRASIIPQEYQPNFKGPYMVLEKADGSCGIVFWYNDKWHLNTRGSFLSDQAIWGTEWLYKNVNCDLMNKNHTYMVEIIYPTNRIVIDYGDKEALVLTGIIDTQTGKEFFYDYLKAESDKIGIEMVKVFHFNEFSELFASKDTLTVNEEGYVITFENGYKFKLKGDEYCRIHRTICNLTLLNFWRIIDLDTFIVPIDFLETLPEEFRETIDSLKEITEKIHNEYLQTIMNEVVKVPEFDNTAEGRKARFIWISQNIEPQLTHSVLGMITGDKHKVRETIHRNVRPTANSLINVTVPERLKRILSDS